MTPPSGLDPGLDPGRQPQRAVARALVRVPRQASFSRTTDGGESWSTPISMTGNQNVYAQGNQVAVLPDGTLVNVFAILAKGSGIQPPQANQVFMAVTRSTDGGRTWHKIEKIAPIRTALLTDPDAPPDEPGPDGAGRRLPAGHRGRPRHGRHLRRLGGRTGHGGQQRRDHEVDRRRPGWSAPRAIDQTPGPHAFNQTVQVAGDGTVAVLYYDSATTRPLRAADGRLAHPVDQRRRDLGGAARDGALRHEAGPNARGWFLGDYMGLEAIGDDLLAFFSTTQGDSANVYSVRANR